MSDIIDLPIGQDLAKGVESASLKGFDGIFALAKSLCYFRYGHPGYEP
jgi:hypothetical protein